MLLNQLLRTEVVFFFRKDAIHVRTWRVLLRTGQVRTGAMSGSSLSNPGRVPSRSSGPSMSRSASSERWSASFHTSSVDPVIPRQQWWIQRWSHLVRTALRWRSPTRRGRRPNQWRRDHATIKLLEEATQRFLEESETQHQGNNRVPQ